MKTSAGHSTVSSGKENKREKKLCPDRGLYRTLSDKPDGV